MYHSLYFVESNGIRGLHGFKSRFRRERCPCYRSTEGTRREGGRAAEANEGIQGNSGGGIGGAAAPVLTKRMNEGRNGLWTKFVLQC